MDKSIKIKQIIDDKLNEDSNIIAGKFVQIPDNIGFFEYKNSWYIYEIDDRNTPVITGPFNTESSIIYAMSLLIHKSKYFEEYKFSEEDRKTYIHCHFRSLREIEVEELKKT